MNRRIKEATVKRFHCGSNEQPRAYLMDFVTASNFAREFKALGGLMLYEYTCKI